MTLVTRVPQYRAIFQYDIYLIKFVKRVLATYVYGSLYYLDDRLAKLRASLAFKVLAFVVLQWCNDD